MGAALLISGPRIAWKARDEHSRFLCAFPRANQQTSLSIACEIGGPSLAILFHGVAGLVVAGPKGTAPLTKSGVGRLIGTVGPLSL